MAERSITVMVSDDVYHKLEEQARSTAQSLDDLVTQTLTHNLPLAPEADLPQAIHAELNAMERLSNEALWAIARSVINDDKLALYDLLIERQNETALTPEGQRILDQLSADADALLLRKAHADALLHDRGYMLAQHDPESTR